MVLFVPASKVEHGRETKAYLCILGLTYIKPSMIRQGHT